MYQKTLSIFIALLAIVFIGSGITGFYSLDDTAGYCSEDTDCQYAVCCPVAGDSYGICAQDYECAEIYRTTSQKAVAFGSPETEVVEKASQSYVAVALGVILLLIIAVVSYVEWQEKPKKRKKRKKK